MSDEDVFAALVALLRPHAPGFIIRSDTADSFHLEEAISAGKPQMFAAVQRKKSYVALHLYPVYLKPELLAGVSAELRQRMHGKSCFNFKRTADIPATALSTLIASARESLVPDGP